MSYRDLRQNLVTHYERLVDEAQDRRLRAFADADYDELREADDAIDEARARLAAVRRENITLNQEIT